MFATKRLIAQKGIAMVAESKIIAWSKAILHAIVVPAVAYGFTPFGWAFSLAYLVLATSLYAATFNKRPAAQLFAPLALFIVIPTIVGVMTFKAFTF
jgi:hypothetical protein